MNFCRFFSGLITFFALSMTGCINIPYDLELAPINYELSNLTKQIQAKFKAKTKGYDATGFIPTDCDVALLLYLKNLSGSDGLPDPIPANISGDDYGSGTGKSCEDQDMEKFIATNYLQDASLISAFLLDGGDFGGSEFMKELQDNPDKANITKIEVAVDASSVNIAIPSVKLYATRPDFELDNNQLTKEGVQKMLDDKDVFPVGSLAAIDAGYSGNRTIDLDENHRESVEAMFLNQSGAIIFQSGTLEIAASNGQIALPKGTVTLTPKLSLSISVDLGDLEYINEL